MKLLNKTRVNAKHSLQRLRLSRYVLQLLLLSLCFNSIAPVLAGHLSDQTKVLICTAQGYQWVEINTQQSDSAPADVRCLLCLASQDDDPLEALSASTGCKLNPSISAATNSVYNSVNLGHSAAFYALGRAPPSLI